MDDMEFALHKARIWLGTLQRNGVNLVENAHVKAAHEALELAQDPSSLEEWADVMIALQGVAMGNGWDAVEQAEAVLAKVSINANRTWEKQPDGTYQHRPAEQQKPRLVDGEPS